MDKKTSASFWTDVGNCERCGNDHEHLLVLPFSRPAGEWTHWATCPMTSEPILVRVVEEPEFFAMFPSVCDVSMASKTEE